MQKHNKQPKILKQSNNDIIRHRSCYMTIMGFQNTHNRARCNSLAVLRYNIVFRSAAMQTPENKKNKAKSKRGVIK